MAGIDRHDIGFTVSGSCDYLAGQTFAFVQTIEAIGAWPPISESHVEMDGAWAMYEGWARLQEGDIDLVLVFCPGGRRRARPGRSGRCSSTRTTSRRSALDPWSLAALQAARVARRRHRPTERDFAEIVARNRANAVDNEYAQVSGKFDVDALLAEPYVRDPLRRHDLAADLRRRGRGRAGRRRPGRVARRTAGVDHRHRPPHRHPPAGHARPDRVARRPRWPRRCAGVADGPVAGGRALGPVLAAGGDPAPGARARRRRSRSTRRAARWPRTR